MAGDVEALLEPEGIGLGQEIDIDAGAQEPLVGQSVVGAGVDDHPPALVAEVEVGAALPGGALRGQTRLGGRRLFAGVGREGETGQGHPEQAEHDGKNAQRIKNAEPDLAHGSGLLSAEMVFQTVVCAKENCLRQECRIFTPGCCTLAGQMCYTSIVSGRFPLAEAGGADYNVLLWLRAVWPQQEQRTASSEDALRCRTVKIAIGGDPYLKQ